VTVQVAAATQERVPWTSVPREPVAEQSQSGPHAKRSKLRLDHVDAMRPVKQAGVVSTHSLLAFAPGAAISVGGALMLLHVTREAFLFISACMLTYGYGDLDRRGYGTFYRRRARSVAVPYVAWTVIYFFVTMPGQFYGVWGGFTHFAYLLGSGYYQLYYLVVIMQFYVAYPALVWLLRRTRGHHVALLLASFALQVLIISLMHWNVLPAQMQGFWASREITSYQFYLVAGMIAALHLHEVHEWVCTNGWKVFAATCGAAALSCAWYVAAYDHVASWLGSASDPFQPIVIPFNLGAIACLYLFGVWLVHPRRPWHIRAMARSGSDNSYGIYLAQMLFIYALEDLAWQSLDHVVPWPVMTAAAVLIVLLACVLLTSILARTPLASALTGRQRQAWSTWLPAELRRSSDEPADNIPSPMGVDPRSRGPCDHPSLLCGERGRSRGGAPVGARLLRPGPPTASCRDAGRCPPGRRATSGPEAQPDPALPSSEP
jgi:peptidoglycan/LPS O-acetylase OafA/YrhL